MNTNPPAARECVKEGRGRERTGARKVRRGEGERARAQARARNRAHL